MYYSEIFFKKKVYDIVEQDIIDFFNEDQEESSILEFKSGDIQLEKVYQEVAALHNSQGGLIIIGSPRPTKDNNGKEFFKGNLTKSNFKHKDWLYQKISSNISPAPTNLRIHDVQIKGGGIIHIIDIPKSMTPPHQCLHNGVYYLRFETETRYAPHGLVETMFNRRQEPIIDCLLDKTIIESNNNGFTAQIKLTLGFANISSYPLIGLHYAISFQNVTTVNYFDERAQGWIILKEETDFNTRKTKHVHSANKSNVVLVSGVSYDSDYNIRNSNSPIMVTISGWASNMNLRKFYFVISPKDRRVFKLSILDDSNHQINFAINEIIANAEAKNENIDSRGLLGLQAFLY